MSLAPRRSLRSTTTVAAVTAVTGTVKTSTGSAVAGATVTIKVGTRTPVVATTNTSGAFSVNAQITQQIYGDSLSNNLGITSARLFPDASVGSFTVTKNIGGGLSRTTTVAAETVLTSSTQITVVLPPA